MRLLKFCALLVVAGGVSVLPFAQQGPQPAPQSQPAAQQQTPAPGSAPPAAEPEAAQDQEQPFRRKIIVPPLQQQKTPQTPDSFLVLRNAQQMTPETQEKLRKAMQKAMQEAMEKDSLRPYFLLGDNHAGSFDRGIYARQVDGANVCGSIVSYNFSPGTDPQLESVTTCTPSNAVTTTRTRVPIKKPAAPHFYWIKFQEEIQQKEK
ncbi:MAG TPA: hypothetical protein VF532_11875 [Candidatus Angelobacter sp.]